MRIGRTQLTVAFVFGVFVWSFSADAQQTNKIPLIGILSDESPALGARIFGLFTKGLRELGWVDGQNITFERRYAAEKYETLASLAGELVRLQPDVIFAIGTPAARAAKTAT